MPSRTERLLEEHPNHNMHAHERDLRGRKENVPGCYRCTLERQVKDQKETKKATRGIQRKLDYDWVLRLANADKDLDEIVYETKYGINQIRHILKKMDFKGKVRTVRAQYPGNAKAKGES